MKNILYVLLFFILISCSPQKQIVEVPVEVVKTEYVHNNTIDSIYIVDSVDRYTRNDTQFIYKNHIEYKYILKKDSIIKVDTVPKIIEVKTIEKVEVNNIKWYQKALMFIGGISALILTLLIVYKLKF